MIYKTSEERYIKICMHVQCSAALIGTIIKVYIVVKKTRLTYFKFMT